MVRIIIEFLAQNDVKSAVAKANPPTKSNPKIYVLFWGIKLPAPQDGALDCPRPASDCRLDPESFSARCQF
jgi:hypothetical protein